MTNILAVLLMLLVLTGCATTMSADQQAKFERDVNSCFPAKDFYECLKSKGYLKDVEIP